MSAGPAVPWAARLVRTLVYAVCAGAFAWPLGTSASAFAAAAGAASGALVGFALAATRGRTPVLIAAAALFALVVDLLAQVAAGSAGLGAALGPQRLLTFVDAARWLGATAGVAAGLTVLSARMRWVAFVEVALGGVIFAQLVSEHRYGAINRPFELADPILVRGGDPTAWFLALGALAAVLLGAMLIMERRLGRLLMHAAVLALLIGGTWWLGERGGVLPGPDAGSSGIVGQSEGKSKKPKQGEGKAEGERQRPDNQQLEFRDQYGQKNHNVPLAVVLLHDDYSPPYGVYYFRQAAFSEFNHNRLVKALSGDVDRDTVSRFPARRIEVKDAPEAGVLRVPLETTVATLGDHHTPFGLEAPVAFEPAQNPRPDRFRQVYRVHSAALAAEYFALLGAEAGAADWDAETQAHYTELPDDPRYTELAEQIVEEIPELMREEPVLRALAVRDWLGEKGTYSLESQHADATDPTAHFLFGDKVGYCVHFAHAAVYLMRALGLPARVATGYAIAESARRGGSAILLSERDAHAWPELYLQGVGWVVVDVTPERSLDAPPQPPDADLQRLLGMLARGADPLPADGSPPPTPLDTLGEQLGRWVVQGGGALVLVLLVLAYLVKLWRRLAPRLAGAEHLPRVLYRAELDRLAEVGLRRLPGESREAFARRLSADAPSWIPLTDAHVGAAFGSRRARALERERLWEQARALRRELRARVPAWRRFLGALTPWSWLAAR